jgi:hypothetical protein
MAMRSWNENESKGLLAQIYAYSKKLAGYSLEVLLQILERSITKQGLTMSQEEKKEVSKMLDGLLVRGVYLLILYDVFSNS